VSDTVLGLHLLISFIPPKGRGLSRPPGGVCCTCTVGWALGQSLLSPNQERLDHSLCWMELQRGFMETKAKLCWNKGLRWALGSPDNYSVGSLAHLNDAA
jgi:hypothetical protein